MYIHFWAGVGLSVDWRQRENVYGSLQAFITDSKSSSWDTEDKMSYRGVARNTPQRQTDAFDLQAIGSEIPFSCPISLIYVFNLLTFYDKPTWAACSLSLSIMERP